MFNFWINPTAFSIGNLQIQWYAIFILTGIIIAAITGVKEGKKLGLNSDDIFTGIAIIVPVAIICARLWYILFNLNEPWPFRKIIGLEGGLAGLAIQGGLIGALISIIIYCRVKKMSFYAVLDIVAPGFFIGQILGRWGNFCNHELYGPIMQNPDLIKWIPLIGENMFIEGAYRHPTFLYESMLNLVGLIIILVSRRKFKRAESGDFMGFYLVWYGMVRCFTEYLRSLSGKNEVLMLGPVKVSTLISIIFIVIGVAFLVLKRFVLNRFYPRIKYIDLINKIEENKPEAIIFDLDGTLLDTKSLIDKSVIYTFEKFRPGYQLTDEEIDSFFGPTLYQSFGKYASSDEELEQMVAAYREYNIPHHDEMVKAFPGAKELCKSLKKKGYKLAVVSSKKTDLVKHGLEICSLSDYFEVVIGFEQCSNPKPAPDGINMALNELEITNPAKAIYVGDTANDIIAGQNANVKTCGVLYATHPEEFIESTPDYVIKHLNDILKICCE